MSDKELHFILSKRRWPFKLSDLFDYYLIVLIPSTITLFSIPLYLNAPSSGSDQEDYILGTGALIVGLALTGFTLVRIRAERGFRTIQLTDQIRVAKKLFFRSQFEELDWILVQANSSYIVAKTKISLHSWGETITLVFDNNRVLFNSTSNQKGLSLSTDRINFNALLKSLQSKSRGDLKENIRGH